MAKQMGLIPIQGTMGNVTFYKTKDGYAVRQKGGVSGDRIKNDPAFARTRENTAEFGRAGKAGKLLRTALRILLQQVGDSRIVGRVTQQFSKVIKADTTSKRGLRNVLDGETELFQGFDFNTNSSLSSTLFAPYTAAIDRATGAATVEIPAFIPGKFIASPPGSTHFKISSAAAEVDFEAEAFVNGTMSTADLPLSNAPTEPVSLVVNLPANSTKPLFLALCIEFMQEVNGELYSLNNGGFNAMAIVAVNGGA